MSVVKCPTTGKVCYSKDAAKKAARSARWRTLGQRITAYRCDGWRKHPEGAGHYHIGHQPRGRASGKKSYRVRPL